MKKATAAQIKTLQARKEEAEQHRDMLLARLDAAPVGRFTAVLYAIEDEVNQQHDAIDSLTREIHRLELGLDDTPSKGDYSDKTSRWHY